MGGAEIQLLSYNVRSLRDDRDAVTAVIRHCRPDVACIQEAPRFWRWRTKAAWLASESGMTVVTGGRPSGLLLLSSLRLRVLRTREVLLTRTPLLHQRALVTAELDLAGVRFTVSSMHLDLEPGPRLRHAREILRHVTADGIPAILAGDVNEDSGGAAWRALAARLPDAWGGSRVPTYSATEPLRQIDAIFADPAITVLSCDVPDLPEIERASDHRPVLATLRLPA
jgi:endonuclease/exonuclease/phosphatase family metal-dependent hydrolase